MAVSLSLRTPHAMAHHHPEIGHGREHFPREVWSALRAEPKAQLVDVRTDAEWSYVGLNRPVRGRQAAGVIPWQIFRRWASMAVSSNS